MPADGTNLIQFPARAPALHVVEQAPAGTHFGPVEDIRPRVDITGGMDGCTVWLLGRPYVKGLTLSNASRVASALMTLDALDCLPGAGPTPPLQPAA